MNRYYELETKINKKADEWELESLRSKNQQLSDSVDELKRNIGRLQAISDNRYFALQRLFDLFAERSEFSDISSEIYELKENL